MDDYIKREDVLAKKQTIYFEYFDSDSGYVEEEGDLAVTVENILKIPAANVRPVVHGEWERKLVPVCDDGIIMIPGNVCSECGGITTYNVSLFKYCPR